MKIHSLSLTIFSVAATLLTPGCKPKPVESPFLYQEYAIIYNTTDSNCTALAAFHPGDSSTHRTTISDATLVTANGMNPKITKYKDEPYPDQVSWPINGPSVMFAFKRNNSTLINKAGRMIGDISIAVDTVLSVNDTIRIFWAASPLQPDETATVWTERQYDTSYPDDTYPRGNIPGTFTGSACTLDFSKTHKFRPGIYTLTVLKEKRLPLQQPDGNASGNITEFIQIRKTVVIN